MQRHSPVISERERERERNLARSAILYVVRYRLYNLNITLFTRSRCFFERQDARTIPDT